MFIYIVLIWTAEFFSHHCLESSHVSFDCPTLFPFSHLKKISTNLQTTAYLALHLQPATSGHKGLLSLTWERCQWGIHLWHHLISSFSACFLMVHMLSSAKRIFKFSLIDLDQFLRVCCSSGLLHSNEASGCSRCWLTAHFYLWVDRRRLEAGGGSWGVTWGYKREAAPLCGADTWQRSQEF